MTITVIFLGIVLLLFAIFVVAALLGAISSIWDLIVEFADDVRIRKNKVKVSKEITK